MPENQTSIGNWMQDTFPGADPASPRKAIRALEECVELCLAAGATPGEILGKVTMLLLGMSSSTAKPEPSKVPGEAADVLIVLFGLAHLRGFDLLEEVSKKMAVNRARRWAPRGDGTGYHVPESNPTE